MTLSLSYTPPDLQEPRPGQVRRRHVFFIHGYDPEARSRYRMLFVRELSRYARRFGEPARRISRAEMSSDGLVQSWDVAALPEVEGAETRYEVLLWDDIVARDFARWRVVSVALLLVGILHWIATGLLVRFYRLNWKMGNVIVYPFCLALILGLAVGLIAHLVHAHLGDAFAHSLGLPVWISAPIGIVAGLAALRAAEKPLVRAYFWQLLNDWVFNWQHGNGWRSDFEQRVEGMADTILAALKTRSMQGVEADEVMIVGHSSGAQTAVEVTARILARDGNLGSGGSSLALVTLGSGIPLVAFQARAHGLRREIAEIVTSRRLVWTEFQAPQDWMNFPGFNPVRHLALDLHGRRITNPLLRSARFRDLINPETYLKVRRKPFRMHFQFLIANDRRGDYDFFAMILGPQRLRERVLAPVVPGARSAGAVSATAE
ncbi:MAG: alpha/beta hydrolase [Methylobacterium sp.]|uniref:alpha/beta hydrolase n=1 Tax=Methylobacterium sp. TaxID=409 RepID=UPI0025EDFA46|nr:alpha/beta hydrolase [Methylobacterium sp.]MBX9933886.1 alpha/beta hydrolase [Methylobacterium sp.]